MAHSTQGSVAAAHDRLGKLPVETIGPDSEKAIAPRADALAANRRRKKNQAPSAASGNGVATQRLNPTTSLPINRTASAGSRNSWCSASATADCPAPTYGSHNGKLPD